MKLTRRKLLIASAGVATLMIPGCKTDEPTTPPGNLMPPEPQQEPVPPENPPPPPGNLMPPEPPPPQPENPPPPPGNLMPPPPPPPGNLMPPPPPPTSPTP